MKRIKEEIFSVLIKENYYVQHIENGEYMDKYYFIYKDGEVEYQFLILFEYYIDHLNINIGYTDSRIKKKESELRNKSNYITPRSFKGVTYYSYTEANQGELQFRYTNFIRKIVTILSEYIEKEHEYRFDFLLNNYYLSLNRIIKHSIKKKREQKGN